MARVDALYDDLQRAIGDAQDTHTAWLADPDDPASAAAHRSAAADVWVLSDAYHAQADAAVLAVRSRWEGTR